MAWDSDQEWERQWWGDCTNTYAEETKQITYAHRMGLVNTPRDGRWPVYDLEGRSVIDIGGGPTSMLLKTVNGSRLVVADPCAYPSWCGDRYGVAGIRQVRLEGEHLLDAGTPIDGERFDEAWIYNVLQHTHDPGEIVHNARSLATVVRVFEWIDIPPHTGHPQQLSEAALNRWLGGRGRTEIMQENGCYGRAFFGVFDGFA